MISSVSFEVFLQGMMILVSVFRALLTEQNLMLIIMKVILVLNFKMFQCKLLPVTFHFNGF